MPPHFDEKEYSNETFRDIEAREGEFRAVEFEGCTFTRSQFGESSFIRCRFIDCRFENCDLSNIKIANATFRGATFSSCKMLGINWTEASVFSHIAFKDSVLNFSNFAGMDLRKIILENCIVGEVDLTQSNLSEAVCKGSDFEGSQFLRSNLTKADFRGSKNYAIHPVENTLKATKFSLPEAQSLLYQLDIILEES